jgi:hypothetical protein
MRPLIYGGFLILAVQIAAVAWLIRPESVEYVIRDTMDDYEIQSALVAYGTAGKTPTILAFGNLTANSVVPISSLTKPITSEAVFRLIDWGRLSLDTKVGGSTVQQLLQHQGGFDRSQTKEQWCEPLNKREFTPGTRASYSNRNYCWLGLAIEQASGQSYEQNVGFRLSPFMAGYGGAAGLEADAVSLFRFFSRSPHQNDLPEVQVADYIPRYRAGWIIGDDTTGHWGVILTGKWRQGQFSIAAKTRDGIVVVAIFDKSPASRAIYSILQCRLLAAARNRLNLCSLEALTS